MVFVISVDWHLICIGIHMVNQTGKKILKCVIFVFIIFLSLNNHNLFSRSNTGVCVNVQIREHLSIKLFTPSETLSSTGQSMAFVTAPLKVEADPVQILVRFNVPRNQMVQLQVQAHGDLVDEYGNTFPISNIGWRATGPGFNDGVLSKNFPQQMGSWVGSNRVFGSVKYFYIQPPYKKGNHTQLITYSLFVY